MIPEEYEMHRRHEDLTRLRDWGHSHRDIRYPFNTRVLGHRVDLMVKDLARIVNALERELTK